MRRASSSPRTGRAAASGAAHLGEALRGTRSTAVRTWPTSSHFRSAALADPTARVAGRADLAWRTRTGIGITLFDQGRVKEALEEYRRTENLLGEPDPSVQVMLRHNEAQALMCLERYAEAEALLTEIGDSYRTQGAYGLLRREWLRGQILLGRGDFRPAVDRLSRVYRRSRDLGQEFLAPEVAVHLSLGHLKLGRTECVLDLTAQVLPIAARLEYRAPLEDLLRVRHQALRSMSSPPPA